MSVDSASVLDWVGSISPGADGPLALRLSEPDRELLETQLTESLALVEAAADDIVAELERTHTAVCGDVETIGAALLEATPARTPDDVAALADVIARDEVVGAAEARADIRQQLPDLLRHWDPEIGRIEIGELLAEERARMRRHRAAALAAAARPTPDASPVAAAPAPPRARPRGRGVPATRRPGRRTRRRRMTTGAGA